jgi:hypothetical protein
MLKRAGGSTMEGAGDLMRWSVTMEGDGGST